MCDGVVLVTDAVPLDGHRVAVRFSDGYSGVLDMAKYFGYPAFAGLNDPAVFATARAGLGTVLWGDGDIDVAPDTAREEALGVLLKTNRFISPSRGAWIEMS